MNAGNVERPQGPEAETLREKSGEKIYFLSDFHLGVPDHASSLAREKRIVAFLSEVEKDAAEIHILGDLFDMWFEYREVVPRGFVRI